MKTPAPLASLRAWLNNIPVPDPVNRHMAALLQVILLGFIAIIGLAAGFNVALAPEIPWPVTLFRSAIAIAIIGLPLGLLRRGHFGGATLVLIGLFTLLETYAVLSTTSLRALAETLSFLTLAIMLAGLLVGRRALVLTFGWSAAVLAFSAMREQAAGAGLDGLTVAGNFILLNGLMSLFLDRFGSTLRAALKAALEREEALQSEIREHQLAAVALRESENIRRLIVATEPECVKLVAPTGELLEMNAAGLRMIEADSLAQVQGLPIAQLIAPEYRAAYAALHQRVLGGEADTLEFEIIGLRGTRRWLETHAVPMRDEAQQVVAQLGVTRDITARKRTEAALKLSQAQLLANLNNTPNVAIQWYAPNGQVLYWNPASGAMYGWAAHEALGKTLDQLIHTPEEQAGFMQILADIRATGQPYGPYEAQVRRRDGTFGWVLATTFGIPMPDDQLGFVCMDVDITEQKQAEAILQTNQKRLQAFFDQSLDGFFFMMFATPQVWNDTIDKEATLTNILTHARYTDVNDAMLKQYRTTRAEFLNRTSSDFFAHDPAQGHHLRKQLFDAGQLHLETYERQDDGTPVWFEGAYVCIYDEHQRIAGFFGIQRDITDRKHAEEALRDSETRLRTVMEAAPLAMAVNALNDDCIVYGNSGLSTLLGVPLADIVGQRVGGYYAEPADYARILAEMTRAGAVTDYELRLRRPDGELLWVSLSTAPITLEDRPCWLSCFYDITQRKQDWALQEATYQISRATDQAANLDALFKEVHTIIEAVLSARNFYIALYDAEHDLLSYPYYVDEVDAVVAAPPTKPGRGMTEYVLRLGQPVLCDMALYEVLRAQGEVELVGTSSPIWLGVPLKVGGRTIGVMTVQDYANPLAYGVREQRMLEYVAEQVAQAIASKQAETELRARQRYLALLNDITRAAIETLEFRAMLQILANRMGELLEADDCYLTFWDEAQQRPIPMTASGALSATFATLVPLAGERTMTASVMEAGHALVAEDVFNSPHYSPRIAAQFPARSMLGLPLIANQQKLGAVMISFNQTHHFTADEIARGEQAAAQIALAVAKARLLEQVQQHAADLEQRVAQRTAQLEATNQELEAFSYSVSHDLRAPLRVMQGYSRLLLEDKAEQLDAESQHYLEGLYEAGKRMGQLIEDLLRLSRVSRAELRRQPVSLSALAHASFTALQQAQPDRRVVSLIAADLEAEGDAPLLRIVLENLLSNAWKFTSHQPHAQIEFGRLDHEGQTVYFVRDNGAGFDMAYAHKLFGVFQRLHAEAEFPGIGIGLATIQRIIHRHGGRIWAEGAVNHGATFYFTL